MEVKVTITGKGIEIKDLTLDEIRKLKEILVKIVDKEVVKETIKEKEYVPYPYYPPVIIEPRDLWDPYPWGPVITYEQGPSMIWEETGDLPPMIHISY